MLNSKTNHAAAIFILILLGTIVVLTACDGSPTAADEDIEGVVADNHGHVAILTVEQLNSGSAVTLDITGEADHSHTVEYSAEEIETILDGDQVVKESSLDSADGSHSHVVTFN
jgi:microcystin-dependent protein